MPTYEYRRADGTTFEFFQRISDEPLTEDPETGQPVERVISGGAGLQFKGSGFYLTDYARKGSEAASTSSSDATNGKDTKKTESKSETDGAAAGSSTKSAEAD